jgi:hypothetical protein
MVSTNEGWIRVATHVPRGVIKLKIRFKATYQSNEIVSEVHCMMDARGWGKSKWFQANDTRYVQPNGDVALSATVFMREQDYNELEWD